LRGTYITADVHIERGLSIGPNHTIRRKVRPHARRLECEDNCAIWRRGVEVGPCHGRRVAHYLGALDEVFESFGRLQGWQCRESVRGYEMNVGKLHNQLLEHAELRGALTR
jgi:hypothetical protein